MTALAERLLDTIRTTVRFISGDDENQDDWSQVAIMEVLRSIGSFRGESSLETWAIKIAIRKTILLVQKNRRWNIVLQALSSFEDKHSEHQMIDDDRFLMRQRLARAFGKLPVKYREVVTLRLVYHYGVDEIAGIVEAPRNTVRQRLRRGRRILREKVEKDQVLREMLGKSDP
ncbi:MAG: sigma-70 family RNA polymerase sigma factor [Myxococcota bacterium]|nr:sigma-70 family RNA polymerase sigma factor [Myxococcota bacterium]